MSFNAICNHFLVCVSCSVLMYHSFLTSASVSSLRDHRQAQELFTHLPHAQALLQWYTGNNKASQL